MDFKKMNLTELVVELNKFRNQILNQGYKMTSRQHARWAALAKEYRYKSEELCK